MKILIVDDEPGNVEVLAECILNIDDSIETYTFTNPVLALEAAEKEDFYAAFLDIEMPSMTGLELAERILSLKPKTNIVFVTAYNHYATEAFDLNAIDYILKPLRTERVQKALAKIIKERRKPKEKEQEEIKALSIYAFGSERLICGDEEVRWNRERTGELFWFLFMNRGLKLRKEHICETLWPEFEEKQALANLQVTVCRLRKGLECFAREQIRIEYINNCYCLNIGEGFCDIQEFENYAEVAESSIMAKAVDIYKGSFLETEGWLWAEVERERLRQKFERLIEKLAAIYINEGALETAEELFYNALQKEFLSESLIMFYLRVSAVSGNKKLELVYKNVCEKYEEYLGMDVPAELKREYTKLLR